MVKAFKIFSYRTVSPMIMKLGMDEFKLYTVHINDIGLTLTYFTPMSNLGKLVFVPRYQVNVYRTIGPLVFILK